MSTHFDADETLAPEAREARLFERLPRFLAEGPTASPRFGLVAADLRALDLGTLTTDGALWAAADTLRAYFLTGDGRPRTRMPGFVRKDQAPSEQAWRRHGAALRQVAPAVHAALAAWARDLNVLLAGGIGRIFAVALEEYRRTLAEHDVVDFPELLQRAVDLLRQMDDFSQSRYRLESRYHHVLLDEFQDTSRLQWQLVALLVQSWGEGFGLVHDAPLLPSLFIVGDRKQSIYRFRDADVTLLDEAAAAVGALRPEGDPRRYISRSFRAKPALLAFVNDVCTEVATGSSRPEAFLYREADRFPLEAAAADAAGDAAVETARDEACVRVIAGGEIDETASRVADEIARILAAGSVRDRATGLPREARAGDVAILFRSRDSHREFEAALEARGIPSYTYKGLGFFDADEIKDVLALVRFLAAPASDLRAAALLRSRFIRLSDDAIRRLAPGLSAALVAPEPPPASAGLEDEDGRVLGRARASVRDWLALVDRLPPDELIDHILAASAYAEELAGARLAQARENVKKIRALIRRIVNRGYATLGRLAAHIDRLSTGDEANAALEAVNAVSLMTVHAAKGLEFPIVFLVNLGRGVARRRSAIRVHVLGGHEEDASVAVDSFQSEADELEPELEREETKRLLYVALTRARDRLYLSTVLRDGAFRCGPGSLGSILPPSLGTVLQAAGSAPDGCALEWKGSSATHRCEVARPPAAPHGPVPRDAEPAEPGPDWPLLQPPMPRVAVTSLGRDGADPQGGRAGSGREDEEVDPQAVGRLVHELLRRVPPGRDISPNELLQIAAGLVPTGTGLDSAAAHAVAGRALDLYWKVTAASEFRELLREGVVEFEVPFTARSKDGLVRGVIDCLVRRRDGSVVVLEFKTGLHRPRHDRQLEVYVRALAGAVPGATGLLVRP